ncbi:hypothetical protein FE783_16310 [Paenibacillus mesophilus]|uniref:hypothetical protein n=1 Tax=Paenibacillus mesophilus TaxID=2582849 RepID=UPI00110F5773|nr:hypothetical protein [Paenibacillus mesophilus]TMV48618.1 hypothetical protein FE783_16310 [Paenibacillus mesophilus]
MEREKDGLLHGCCRCCARVRRLIDSGEQIEKEIGMARLTDYVGGCDDLFVIHEGEGIASLADRPLWRQLPAVASGRAFELHRS